MSISTLASVAADPALAEFGARYGKNRAALVGLTLIASLTALAVLAPVVTSHDPTALGAAALRPPSLEHVMGTDDLGRDTLSRFCFGARVSLTVGIVSAAIATLLGTLVGTVSGYVGGAVDEVLMRVAEFFQVVPRFFLALVMVAIFGPWMWTIVIVIGILSWPPVARLARAQVLSLRRREFVDAARALGGEDRRVLLRHVLPNAIPPVVVIATLEVGTAILLEAGLSFIGLGDPERPSWGHMLNVAQKFLRSAWWLALFPGLGIFVAVLSFNLIGDGLNDALSPRRERR